MKIVWKELGYFGNEGAGSHKKFFQRERVPGGVTKSTLGHLIKDGLKYYKNMAFEVCQVLVAYEVWDNGELIVRDADRLFDYWDFGRSLPDSISEIERVAKESYDEALQTGSWYGPGFDSDFEYYEGISD